MATSIAMLVISVGMSSAVNGGFFVSHLDLTPNYAGILVGLGNTLANCFFIGAPHIVQSLSSNEVRYVDHETETIFGKLFGI